MSIISIPNIFSVGAVIVASQHNSNFSTIYNNFNGLIDATNLSPTAAIADTQLAQISTASKISGAALSLLGNIPSGAGLIPYVNITSFPYIKCSNTRSQNTAGGAGSTGSWQVNPLGTKDFDTASIGTLSSNQLALPSGTYQIQANAIFYSTNQSQCRLYNVTDSSVILVGQSTYTGANSNNYSPIKGQFTISSGKTIRIEYQIATSVDTQDLGKPANFGTEVYAQLELWKIG